LYELLVCPGCGGTLEAASDALGCPSGHAFPIVDGIPRFTPPSSYADSFGFEWTSFPRLQLDSDRDQESASTFRDKTGLGPDDVAGKTVLDAGCGMGRFTHVVARWGADRAVGVDISRAVEAAGGNLEAFPSVALTHADLTALPFPPESFDIVFSIGVLHHTPNTFQSLAQIAKLVKPGGMLAVWVYSKRLRWTLLGSEVLRPLTSRMPPSRLLRLVEWVTPRTRAIKRKLPATTVPLDILLPTSNHPDPEWQVLDTFDWYSPRFQWKHTYEEVEGWFRRLGFESVERLRVPVAVRGRRPS
jgi:SAM-dependent methyltransferase